MRHTYLLFTLAACAAGVLPAIAATTTAQILDANHAAMGGAAWDGKAALEAEYAYAGQGFTGKTESLTDLRSPRYIAHFNEGPLHGVRGFDGRQAWTQEPSGSIDIEAGGDARQRAVSEAYRRDHLWWRADRGGARIANVGVRTRGGTPCEVLRVTPQGGQPFEAWFDARSHLLVRIHEMRGPVPITTTLSHYRRTDGAMLARRIVIRDDQPSDTQTLTLRSARFVPPQPDAAYAIPKVTVTDYQIEGGGHETTIPFKLINNHIYAEASVDGQGPFQFIFDTGGMNLVTPALAKRLGLKSEGDLKIRGAGTRTLPASLTHMKVLEVGRAVLDDTLFVVTPLDTMADVEGVPMPGMVGFEMFRRFVTRIDYGNRTITLIDPKDFDPKTAGTPVAFTLNGRTPEIHGRFEGIRGTFDIDTGSRSALTLNGPFVRAHKLRASHPKGLTDVEGWGVGGPSTGYVTHGASLRLGSVEVRNIVTAFNNQSKGDFAGKDYSGNIGGGVLKRFVVTFDYGHGVMYLKPISEHMAHLDSFDRSGLWINAAPGGFAIVNVARGTPAANAGLETGDLITAVDGKAAKTLTLYGLRRRLRDAAVGTHVAFAIRRDGQARTITITLADLI